ncbi:phage tail assembly protein T [Actinocorallia longicatena]|uniref:Minor tail T domain-containing protein n=1 Tax=Actinocorallia longicatena TaxID=111803 RepID=A0ABP6QGW4_9ACTN
MTVAELLARISSAEITEWAAYEEIAGPLGPARGDIQTALVASTIANANRGKGPKAKIKDFLLTWDRRPQTWQEQLAIVKQLHARMTRKKGGDDDGETR